MITAALVCAVSLVEVRPACGQIMGLGAPMTVRFVGTFTPWAKDTAGGPDSLAVTIGAKQYFFHVTDVGSYEGSDPGMMLLSHIFPPELEFVGPGHRLDSLKDPAKGKKYMIEGWLYVGDNMFYVAAVRPLSS